ASIGGDVDEILVADGLIDGVDADGLPPFSDQDHLAGLQLAYGADVQSGCWTSQSAQRQWTLEEARRRGCDWLLAIDADEELRNPHMLRPWLDVWHWDAFPIPFYFADNAAAHPAAFKCLRVSSWRRYVCQGSFLENQAGETVQVNGQTAWRGARESGMPYLVHRPELRPLERQTIRLSESEVTLEPFPVDAKVWQEPVYTPRLLHPDGHILPESLPELADLGLPVWYCDGCGTRYAGPGSCTRGHAPIGLQPLEVAAA
ncbi:MAG: hypothetical protein B7X10_00315, partial [Burkholderiales bacterium 21-58-4]